MTPSPPAERQRRSYAKLAVTLLFPVALVVYSVAFHQSIQDLRTQSRAYPQVVMMVLAVLILSQVATDVVDWLRRSSTDGLIDIWRRWGRSAYTALWTFVFVIAMGRVGFYEALIVYVALLLPMIGVRRVSTVVMFTIGMVAAMYLLFDLTLSVRLPTGLLFG